MSTQFYLPRTLVDDTAEYSEAELLAKHTHIVVLAEPGGGLARQLGVGSITANVFAQLPPSETGVALVIDAFDELAKIDATGIHRLLATAKRAAPTHFIVSSRSSEWDNAATAAFKDFLGIPPKIVRFREFNNEEQTAIFENHAAGESFSGFQEEVARFDLDALLPNPQFLKLFADAYIESGRKFSSKRSIFEQAVDRLAKEANEHLARGRTTLPIRTKVKLASEAFAKLLLSGAEGVGTREVNESKVYPLLSSLIKSEDGVDSILATRLFKPGDTPDHHRPVHKIVAEYCAADYLTKRIADPKDPLTFTKCLPVIAPNSIVRDELRGMLGWMASLGNKAVQERAIELDPYAVLANGDPSQLEPNSKRLLIDQLRRVAEHDPYFRRADFWRRFSVAGFFDQDVLNQISSIITGHDGRQLRYLMLELLQASPAISSLTKELQQIVLSPEESEQARLLSSKCLLNSNYYDQFNHLAVLIFESSEVSLNIAANIIETKGMDRFDTPQLVSFFQVCAGLYPLPFETSDRKIGARSFIRHLINKLELTTVDSLLDQITEHIKCECGKGRFDCKCNTGISKIVGLLLDRHFALSSPPHDAKQIWRWCRNLNFHENIGVDRSEAVRVLQTDHCLRQGVISEAFSSLTDRNEIFNRRIHHFDFHSHSGLRFQPEDYSFVIQLAYDIDNPQLWSSFFKHHERRLARPKGISDPIRRLMRVQASKKPIFMKEWARSNTAARKLDWQSHEPNAKFLRRLKRRRQRENDIRIENIRFIQENRTLIENGRHWGFLSRFANLILMKPEKIQEEFGESTIASIALKNCLDFLGQYVPSPQRIAELQCISRSAASMTVLYAACLEIFREQGNLSKVANHLLQSLRTSIDIRYDAVTEEERHALKTEIDRLLFPNLASTEEFLRQYMEPQLSAVGCRHTQAWWLQEEEVFKHIRGRLSLEWLQRYRGMDIATLDILFEIALQDGDRNELHKLIEIRCAEFMFFWPDETTSDDLEQRRNFWLVRSWVFVDPAPKVYWNWLKHRKATLLIFFELFGSMSHAKRALWPRFTSKQIEAILDAFIDHWPKVDLPDHYGTGSPDAENAYRFIRDIVWWIERDNPTDAIPVLDRLLSNARYGDLHDDIKSIRASQMRIKALRDFQPPLPLEITELLDNGSVVTVSGLRSLVIDELQELQDSIDGGEFNSGDRFFQKGERLDEIGCTNIIAERLSLRLQPQSIIVTPEHQLKNSNRSDFTVSKLIGGTRRLLVTEVKGQWHPELYTAASAQLAERYSIHPDAEKQGIFLAIWFGPTEKVAGRRKHNIQTANELQKTIIKQMPEQLHNLINVFVLDVSIRKKL